MPIQARGCHKCRPDQRPVDTAFAGAPRPKQSASHGPGWAARAAGNRLRRLPALGARSAEVRDANVFADRRWPCPSRDRATGSTAAMRRSRSRWRGVGQSCGVECQAPARRHAEPVTLSERASSIGRGRPPSVIGARQIPGIPTGSQGDHPGGTGRQPVGSRPPGSHLSFQCAQPGSAGLPVALRHRAAVMFLRNEAKTGALVAPGWLTLMGGVVTAIQAANRRSLHPGIELDDR